MACSRCGRNGHWESECFAKTRSYEACFRCGRASHWASECYASTRIDGSKINSNSYSTQLGSPSSIVLRSPPAISIVRKSPSHVQVISPLSSIVLRSPPAISIVLKSPSHVHAISPIPAAITGKKRKEELNPRRPLSPLMNATLHGNAAGVQMAINNGGDLSEKDDNGMTCLMHASDNDKRDIIQVIIQASDLLGSRASIIETQDHLGDTALCWACMKGNIESVKLLLVSGANPNHAAYSGRTPMMKAASNGHPSVISILLAFGGDLNRQALDGMSALMWAAQLGKLDCLQELLANGAQVNIQDRSGRTALQLAHAKDNKACVAVLQNSSSIPARIVQKSVPFTTTQPIISRQQLLQPLQKLLQPFIFMLSPSSSSASSLSVSPAATTATTPLNLCAEWACSACTFINQPSAAQCDVCGGSQLGNR